MWTELAAAAPADVAEHDLRTASARARAIDLRDALEQPHGLRGSEGEVRSLEEHVGARPHLRVDGDPRCTALAALRALLGRGRRGLERLHEAAVDPQDQRAA